MQYNVEFLNITSFNRNKREFLHSKAIYIIYFSIHFLAKKEQHNKACTALIRKVEHLICFCIALFYLLIRKLFKLRDGPIWNQKFWPITKTHSPSIALAKMCKKSKIEYAWCIFFICFVSCFAHESCCIEGSMR